MDQAMRRKRSVFLGVALASTAIASGILWIALDHNPQGGFYGSELGVNWSGMVVLWACIFATSFVILGALVWALLELGLAIGSRRSKDRRRLEK